MSTSERHPEHPSPIPRVIGIAMLAWALVPANPYGYYIILRFVFCGVCAFLAFKVSEQQSIGWAWALGITAVIYNPIIPVHLTREIWSIVNIATIALLAGSIAVLNGIRRAGHGEQAETHR